MQKHIFAVLSLLIISATSVSALVSGDGGCTGPFIPLGGELLKDAQFRPYPGPYPGPTCPGPMQALLPECEMLPNCRPTKRA